MPVPTRPQKSGKSGGKRKTSPCTCFHPVSSGASPRGSSSSACVRYLCRSDLRVRIRISATRPTRKSTIMKELKMENQWIWCSKKSTSR
jgi:hypothetical protein